jgi:uncharacterized protein GlcG (DUF336 family)
MKFIRFAVLAAISAPAFAQLPAQKMLTLDVAQTIAQEAMMKCRADGFRVTVRVVDSANILKTFVRDDGAPMGTLDMARMKTNTVMSFGRPSGPPANLAPGAPVPPPLLADTINFKGGVPIKVDEQLIGAVAVSGASTDDKDAACANAGLAKVADKLK